MFLPEKKKDKYYEVLNGGKLSWVKRGLMNMRITRTYTHTSIGHLLIEKFCLLKL